MTQQRATRKYDDSVYGNSGYWYYRWPALHCVFRTDYPDMKFNPDEETEELTLPEFLDAAFTDGYRLPHQDKEIYYYSDVKKRIFKSKVPVNNCLELTASEYIELSLLFDVNQDDTLL